MSYYNCQMKIKGHPTWDFQGSNNERIKKMLWIHYTITTCKKGTETDITMKLSAQKLQDGLS